MEFNEKLNQGFELESQDPALAPNFHYHMNYIDPKMHRGAKGFEIESPIQYPNLILRFKMPPALSIPSEFY